MTKSYFSFARSLVSRGFFHIFGASALNKVIAFVTNILIVRFLTKDDYGLFSYANSIFTIILLFTGLGLVSGMFVYAAEDRPERERQALYRYALTRGLLVDCILALALLIAAIVIPFPLERAGTYIALLAPLLILDYVFQYTTMKLRIMRENKKYAGMTNINTAGNLVFGCCGAWLGGIAGTIGGRYVAYVLSIAACAVVLKRKDVLLRGGDSLSRTLKRELWGFSLRNQTAAGLNCMSYSVQMIILGAVLQSSGDLAAYKVASAIPEGLAFMTSAATLFLGPYVIEHRRDRVWLSRYTRVFFVVVGSANLAIAVLLCFGAGGLVRLVWGSGYGDAVLPLQILALNYFVGGTFRTIPIEMLACLKKTGYNLFISVVWFAINVFGTYVLASAWGLLGAAASVVMNSVISGAVALPYLVHVIRKADSKESELELQT